jgi:hypothetical protein
VSLGHVLAVLEDNEPCLLATLGQAVSLAELESARLTLAKTTDPGRMTRWFARAAPQTMHVRPSDYDFDLWATYRLTCAMEFVPSSLPVTTILLGQNTARSLLDRIKDGKYDAFVSTDKLLADCPRLSRELVRLGIHTVSVSSRQIGEPKITKAIS